MNHQNFLSPSGFQFNIERLPETSFYVQSVSLPGFSMGITEQANPFKTLKYAGDKLQYDSFSLSIRMDEAMNIYHEIYDWMVGLTKPESFEQYRLLKESQPGLYSDASLIVLSSKNNPIVEYKFKDIFPVAMSNVQLSVMDTDMNYVTADITFEHNGIQINRTPL